MEPSHATHSRVRLYLALAILLIIGFACWWQLRGGPPRKIVFAAGGREGAYYRLAQRYKDELAKSGLEVEILETNGSVENLRLLEDARADIAFVQSGLKGQDRGDLRSLGAMFYEPVWVFVRGGQPEREFAGLVGKRVAVGEKGSGTLEVARTLLADNRLLDKVQLQTIGGEEAKTALLNGKVDAMFTVGAPSIPLIKELANRKDIALVSLIRAEAYTRYHSSLSTVTLYRGMLNLAQDIPSQDRPMLATSANLVVSERFHYALVTLMLQTARAIHGTPGPFRGEFPAARPVTFPLVAEAQEFYRSGPSFFYRHLPFYMAANLDRVIFLLLPLLTLLIPLSRMLPPFLDWIQNRSLNRLQTELASLELNRERLTTAQALQRLEQLREEIWRLKKLPPDKQNDVFLLQLRFERLHEDLSGASKEQARPRAVSPAGTRATG